MFDCLPPFASAFVAGRLAPGFACGVGSGTYRFFGGPGALEQQLRQIVAPARSGWRLLRLLTIAISLTLAVVGPAFSEALAATVVRVSPPSADARTGHGPSPETAAKTQDRHQHSSRFQGGRDKPVERIEDRRIGRPMASGHATVRNVEKQPFHLPLQGWAPPLPLQTLGETTSPKERALQQQETRGYDSRAPPLSL